MKVNDVVGDDEVFVDINYVKAARMGIDVADIGSGCSADAEDSSMKEKKPHDAMPGGNSASMHTGVSV